MAIEHDPCVAAYDEVGSDANAPVESLRENPAIPPAL